MMEIFSPKSCSILIINYSINNLYFQDTKKIQFFYHLALVVLFNFDNSFVRQKINHYSATKLLVLKTTLNVIFIKIIL